MPADVDRLYEDLVKRAARYSITVRQAELDDEVPGEFDGPTITLNRQYDAAERAFYLNHSIGSIAEWSLHFERSKQIIDELRQAKESKGSDKGRFERALADYLAFEDRTWQFAAGLLAELGHSDFLPAFNNFGRADMESMRIFHSTGKAPVWREFFAAWNDEVRRGVRTIEPFTIRPIPAFQAVKIPKQEIVQEDDEE